MCICWGDVRERRDLLFPEDRAELEEVEAAGERGEEEEPFLVDVSPFVSSSYCQNKQRARALMYANLCVRQFRGLSKSSPSHLAFRREEEDAGRLAKVSSSPFVKIRSALSSLPACGRGESSVAADGRAFWLARSLTSIMERK